MNLPFSDGFALHFAQGLIINFQIAFMALILGLALGALLAAIHKSRLPVLPRITDLSMNVLRAMPVYIAMFFLAGVMRPYYSALEDWFDDPGIVFVTLACLPYICSYAYDQVGDAILQWRRGAHRAALLLIPNMVRAFQVLVSASCFGAAIGVNEAMSAVLTEAELIGNTPWRYVLFLLMIVLFVILMQIIVVASRWVHRMIERNYADAHA
ncbi:hypothetical protein [Thalassococcus sp. S3]|uniref:hypothetical protein n=1 Tax=Thalassococcus sp. S3 TaxID=2017482 RepID=UPI0010246B7D|nr:hypothetical protein [Thalassococcus sp. S3]QBF34008.1 hypothetical protein CFI11_22770 [Thalassococcus sp. S3]